MLFNPQKSTLNRFINTFGLKSENSKGLFCYGRLKEAKDLVDGAPNPVREGISQKDADEAKQKLEEVGATVEIK